MLKSISVIVVTKNEGPCIEKCLSALAGFDHVVVVDSESTDKTQDIARACGAEVVGFCWNARYPKKRQWCLENILSLRDWVLFIDADEIMTPGCFREIAALDGKAAGYFVPGQYLWRGKMLRFGLRNNKIALMNRHKMAFPIIDDLDLPGMGEIEGHYQPVLKAGFEGERVAQLRHPLIHEVDYESWLTRHERYAAWERGMNARGAWPRDARMIKRTFKTLPFKPQAAFLHSYFLKGGVLDGKAGFDFARARALYYAMISGSSKNSV